MYFSFDIKELGVDVWLAMQRAGSNNIVGKVRVWKQKSSFSWRQVGSRTGKGDENGSANSRDMS